MNELKEIKELKKLKKRLKENLKSIEHDVFYDYRKDFITLIVRIISLTNDKELTKQICESKDRTLKEQALIYGNDAIRWKLIDDKDTWIRVAVAEYGNDAIRWKLIDDETWRVRLAVAKYGSKEMCEILKNDKDEDVRNKAEERLRDLEALFKKIIAKYRTDVKRWRLIDDEDVLIRLAVAKYGSKEMCEILKNDKDEDVRRVAENRLEELEKEKRKDERIKESEE